MKKIFAGILSASFLTMNLLFASNTFAAYSIAEGAACGSSTDCNAADTNGNYCEAGLVCAKDSDSNCVCKNPLSITQTTAGLSQTSVPTMIGTIIKVILGLSGTIALIFIIWGGIKWMISKGEAEQIKKARQLMTSGIIGIAIIAAAYAITDFVIKQITVVAA